MKSIFLLELFLNFKVIQTVTCHCFGSGCGLTEECKGQYCYTTWVLEGGEVDKTGCVTSRQELSTSQCVKTRKGSVTCVCSEEFAIPSDATFYTPPTIKCDLSTSTVANDFCFGHSCDYNGYFQTNEFGDVFVSEIDRECSDYPDMLNFLGRTNSCQLVEKSLTCSCGTAFCNKQQPYEVKIGKVKCYKYDPKNMYKSEFCYGDLCYRWKETLYGVEILGCMSLGYAEGLEYLSKPGSEGSSNILVRFCDENLCNGDYKPN
ncbi:unnamed protein product [Caenorhabditis angaria]|uniref:DUF7622 domain-containing protein n=1 Tax=Caenorhabditis angaria TaxID=860376 RepID=A0A9P1IUY1_9PELO|nr:unnamed protein product [Caenorhabditis angaria]